MTRDERKEYARNLILSHARDIEYLTIFEASDEYLDAEISDDDADAVSCLIDSATISVSWDR